MTNIIYKIEETLDPSEFIKILNRSTLGERRPVNDFNQIEEMCKNANLIITARLNGKLIGVARSITDFVYFTYLSDLAVDTDYQKRGICKRLIAETKMAAPQTKIILLSAPAAVGFYPKIGMKKHDYCFTLDDIKELK